MLKGLVPGYGYGYGYGYGSAMDIWEMLEEGLWNMHREKRRGY